MAAGTEAASCAVVTIRNTFVEMQDEASCEMRRSNSAPALLAKDIHSEFSLSVRPSPFRWSDEVSTDALSDTSEDEASSDSAGAPSGPPSPCAAAPAAQPGLVASRAGRSPLNSRAKAWEPIAAQGALDNMPRQDPFHAEAMSVAQEVAAMLRKSRVCMGAQVCWHSAPHGPSSCILTATIGVEHLQFAEQLATATKEAMLACTAYGRGVRLLGCRQRPFSPVQQGFVATLGNLPEGREVCRSIYEGGFCKYGTQCYSQHPTSTVTFSFAMVVAGPQIGAMSLGQQHYFQQ